MRSVYFEPNQLKIEMDKMLLELDDRIRVYYHCWATKPIMEGNEIKGVIFESKEGRKAIMAKTVIDATGDGDIFAQAGAPYNDLTEPVTRVNTTALVFRVGGVDYNAYDDWKRNRPEAAQALGKSLEEITGFRIFPIASNQNDIVWFNNWVPNMDCSKIKDLTSTEFQVRDKIRDVIEFMRRAVPLHLRMPFYTISHLSSVLVAAGV